MTNFSKTYLATSTKISLIALGFGLLGVYQISKHFQFMKHLIANLQSSNFLSTAIFSLPIVLLPIGAILFWRKFKLGWIIICAFLISSVGRAINLFIKDKQLNQQRLSSNLSTENQSSGLMKLQDAFPAPNPFKTLLVVIFFGVFVWVICRKDISSAFKLNRETKLGIILLMAILNVLAFFS